MDYLTPGEVIEFAQFMQWPISYHKNKRLLGPQIGARPPPQGCQICVENFPFNFYEDRIVPLFRRCGPIFQTKIIILYEGVEPGVLPRGKMFIIFDDPSAVTYAKRFNNYEIFPGYKLKVEIAEENCRIFVGGIPDTATKEQVCTELLKAGFNNVVDVIMYQSYAEKNKNRGFVFVEFKNHYEAEEARLQFKHVLLFGIRVHIDWSTPITTIPQDKMQKVTKLFLRNFSICETKPVLVTVLKSLLGNTYNRVVQKVYRFRDYAFIHFRTRQDAENAMKLLKGYYRSIDSTVEVEWAKPVPEKNNNKENIENQNINRRITSPNQEINFPYQYNRQFSGESSHSASLDNSGSGSSLESSYNLPSYFTEISPQNNDFSGLVNNFAKFGINRVWQNL